MTDTAQETIVDEEAFEATVTRGDLVRIADALDPVVDEARLHFTTSELHASAVDPANVMAVDSGRYEIEANRPATVGVDVDELHEALHFLASSDEQVTIQYEDGDDELTILDNHWVETVPVIDEDTIRDDRDLNDILERIDFEVVGTAESWEFAGSINKVALAASRGIRFLPVADAVLTEGDRKEFNEDDGEFERVWGYQDEFDADLERRPATYDGAVSVYSPGYLEDLAQALPTEGTVTFHTGDNIPLIAESSEGPRIVVAPRLKDPVEDDR
ncbi:hypothetical protein ACFQO4_20900 [Saliphagus sp. GCM10025334]